ncbi:Good for full DBP5 activity protein 2 [Colletotrichum chlorophyti]|uniref:Good for full DBP5 activity protein 2 n=1 Tax=Colletotrichum chlorophyti TaxID=708187 RepID=A0A1Q8S085_9PEZI|nr:Good for full DBP5 activity protein 2 [Colletotrichum chlorophyti]
MTDLYAEKIERLKKAFGRSLRFKEGDQQDVEDAPEDFTLDPLALDRQIAAQRAAKEGKSIAAVASKSKSRSQFEGPPLRPSTSERLAPADFNALMMQDFQEFKSMKAGELSAEGMTFVAWDVVQRYPERFIGKTNRPKASFYIYHPKALDSLPYIFVPTKEFEHFLDVINASIQTKLAIPPGKPSEIFYIAFGESCSIRPKYLGRSASHNEYLALRDAIPAPKDDDACPQATPIGMEMLLSLLNMHTNYRDPKTRSRKKQQAKAQSRDESLYDLQLYLGLRSRASEADGKGKKADLDQPVPHQMDQNVVFVCIDIEVAEEHHGTILEIGISVLDTKNLIGVPPGQSACNWFPFIKSRHLITEEYRFIRNRKYIKGCPELFNFGESEYPKLNELADKVNSALTELSTSGQEDVAEADKRYRNIVLLGHNIRADLSYLENIGVQPWGIAGMMRNLDTKDMHQAWRNGTQGRSLGNVLVDLGIVHGNLHNGGNDATYTMQAMLGLAVESIMDRGEKK